MKLVCSANKGFQQDTQRRIGANLQLCLTLILENTLSSQLLSRLNAPPQVGVTQL